ncbi:hypothetical protein N3K59_18865 [Acinetobacter baumannii]|uniref:hypothetical protein n=1 Tax=Acinetobacter calcoaceticus/baumannii complex TaxID=909768 RepID=UPI00157FDB91|nr:MULTISPECIES: hypothetical protein [Acinetobacter calcoaceticus/baumannii complex]EKU4535665.1 hypothetical protein [Acinetobacter baumannii]EKU4539678.1 hypothetical protein [Acinetobacter baumannii]EKX0729603.1 hypothetical protein [Acinetobacter baumannii]ELA8291241.1 hypothetical protein [Acinetobacter baumannii]ELN5403007.1 hypothetical protein [Acinetobacter baumannii]
MQNLIDQKQLDQFWSNPGIVNQEFDQETINRCKPILDGIAHRVLKGETTLEEEELKLLAEWKNLNP